MTILPKAIHRFNTIPIKIPIAVFTKLEQIILKFVWKQNRPWIAKIILRKKNKAQSWRHHTSLFLILQRYSNQNSMVLAWNQTHRSMKQKREPGNEFILIWPVNLQQRRQEYTMGKGQPLQLTALWNLDMHEVKLVYFITPYTKVNSKRLKDLTVRPESIKLLERNRHYTLKRTGLGHVFSVEAGESKNKQTALCQTKKHCTMKGSSTRQKGSLPSGRTYLQTIHLIRDKYPKYTKQSYNPA